MTMTKTSLKSQAKFRPQFRPHTLATLLMLSGIVPATSWADDFAPFGDPAYDPVRKDEVLGLSVAEGLRYDSNVFRLSDDSITPATSEAGQKHDFISTTTLRAGFDKRFGRHRLFLLAAPSIVRYANFDQLNYVGGDFLADWSGLLGTTGRYGLNYEHIKVATDPADQLVPTGNRATKDQIGADLAVPTGPSWQAVTAWHADHTRNSSPTEQGGDNDGWAGDAGIRYAPVAGDNIDLRYRHSRYTYPNVIPSQLADNSYKQNEVELSGNWRLSEPSQLEGRTSYVKRSHDNFAERDFSGWIGSLKYIWRPTLATSSSFRIFRDIGAVTDSSASYAKSYGISIQPAWEATSKITFGGLLEWQRRNYNGFSVVFRPAERTAKAGLNARYAATRNWQFAFSVSDERRRSSDATRQYSDVISALAAEYKM
ncbi:MAG: hypothetical protein JWN23_2603 [Rhodocyclales bacterium]|nr:hypothetical protein [Rhodocyclales bacterium]